MLPPELPLLQEVASSVHAASSSPLSGCLPAALAGPEGSLQSQVDGLAGSAPADMQELLYLYLTTCTPPVSEAALCNLMRQVSLSKDAAGADAFNQVTLTHGFVMLACFGLAPSQSISLRHRGSCALPVVSPDL